MEDEFTPDDALRQIDEVDRRARRPARSMAMTFTVMGFATIAYWLVMSLGPGWSKGVAGVTWIALTVASVVQMHRMGVKDREVEWVNRPTGPVTVAYCVLTVAVMVFGVFLRPDDPGGLWVAALVVLTVGTSLPLFYAVWRILRAAR
ncbi:hypothetical protein [Planobispora takensis]|uniref:Peptidase C30 domain-containing protein n=1 Tax=Planobispora takensis TaxID=1367882 RepID=A0A8J3WSZ9_9ACTN|nr:hypothetical protein [Planobispora takensis]GII01254.1 hypothetical protein Pta02_32620 [Planobispora takensis]